MQDYFLFVKQEMIQIIDNADYDDNCFCPNPVIDKRKAQTHESNEAHTTEIYYTT